MDKNDDINKALIERLYIVEFLFTYQKNNTNINNSLKDEEANIIIFCNKIYFSFFNKKQIRLKNTNKKQIKTNE